MKHLNHQRGFTLIEVVVSVAILAVLSIYTARSIQRAVKTKVKIQKEIERTSVVRDAMKVIERDINLAFNYRDINVDLYNAAGAQRQSAGPSPSASQSLKPGVAPSYVPPQPQASPFKPKPQKIFTQFFGANKEISFTTLSNIRTQADAQTSDQAVVGYMLKDCANRINKSLHSQCLWRRLNPILTDDITKGGDETVLLENVTRFELRYLGPEKTTEWVKDWSTGPKGDDLTRGKFPYAVEITIEAHNKNIEGEKPVSMTWVASLRFPNNPNPSQSAGGVNGQGQGQGVVGAPIK